MRTLPGGTGGLPQREFGLDSLSTVISAASRPPTIPIRLPGFDSKSATPDRVRPSRHGHRDGERPCQPRRTRRVAAGEVRPWRPRRVSILWVVRRRVPPGLSDVRRGHPEGHRRQPRTLRGAGCTSYGCCNRRTLSGRAIGLCNRRVGIRIPASPDQPMSDYTTRGPQH